MFIYLFIFVIAHDRETRSFSIKSTFTVTYNNESYSWSIHKGWPFLFFRYVCTYLSIWWSITIFMYYLFAESICTHYYNLSGQPNNFLGSGTFKKSWTLLFAKSRVQKTRVIVIQKEKRLGCLFSFWIIMTLVFCTLFFFKK